jgi:hypothetical protein
MTNDLTPASRSVQLYSVLADSFVTLEDNPIKISNYREPYLIRRIVPEPRRMRFDR